MRTPSVKTLMSAFHFLDAQDAKRIRYAMANRPEQEAMEIIDAILGTYGLEHIPAGHNQRSPSITYCNAGDSYGTTILYVNGSYRVGSWGDIVERGNYD